MSLDFDKEGNCSDCKHKKHSHIYGKKGGCKACAREGTECPGYGREETS